MHTRQPRSRIVMALFASLTLVATVACSPQTGSSPDSGAPTITLAIQSAPASLDPAQLQEGQQSYLWTSVYDTLLYLDNNGSLKPNAAESWSYSNNHRTMTLELREGMTFSTGAPVNAAAVKATLERTKSTPGQQQSKLEAIESIETPDDSTVVLRLAHPDASLLTSFAMAAGVIADPATVNDKRTALNPVGSGPYVLDEQATVEGTTYVLKRRADYWNAKAYPFERFTIRVLQDPTAAFNALQAGELDAATVQAGNVSALRPEDFTVKEVEATAIGNLVLADRNGTVAPALADVRVRKAINMAFDRKKIVQQLLRGVGKPTAQLFNPKGDAYDASLDSAHSFDPRAAKALLTEAGYPDGFSVTMPSTIVSKSFEPTITQALGDIGIKVTWDPVPPQNTVESLSSTKYPMVFFIEGLSTAQREVQNNFAPNGFLNPFGTTDPRLEKLINEADTAVDEQQATRLYQRINEFVVENAWDAPLFYVGTNWATKPGITYLGDGSSTLNTIRTFDVAK